MQLIFPLLIYLILFQSKKNIEECELSSMEKIDNHKSLSLQPNPNSENTA